jgi:hypothetical protein
VISREVAWGANAARLRELLGQVSDSSGGSAGTAERATARAPTGIDKPRRIRASATAKWTRL